MRLEGSHISLHTVFNPFLKRAELLDASVLFQVTHCVITDNFKHRVFERFIYSLSCLDCRFCFGKDSFQPKRVIANFAMDNCQLPTSGLCRLTCGLPLL